jgi:hypothetical protein
MNNFAAGVPREKRPQTSAGGAYTSDSFRPLNNNPSAAVHKIKTKFAQVESQTLSYRKRFNEVSSSTGVRAKSAPAHASPSSAVAHQLLHLPGMHGYIPARVNTKMTYQVARQVSEKRVKKIGIRTLLKGGPEDDSKHCAKVNIDAKSIQRDFNTTRLKTEKDKSASKHVETGWSEAKDKVRNYRAQEAAIEYLGILADDESQEDELLDALEELSELARNEDSFSATLLYEAGSVNILIDLLKRVTGSWEVQYRACDVLKKLSEHNGELTGI